MGLGFGRGFAERSPVSSELVRIWRVGNCKGAPRDLVGEAGTSQNGEIAPHVRVRRCSLPLGPQPTPPDQGAGSFQLRVSVWDEFGQHLLDGGGCNTPLPQLGPNLRSRGPAFHERAAKVVREPPIVEQP